MNRRNFVLNILLTSVLLGCKAASNSDTSDSTGDDAPKSCTSNNPTGVIASNHGHSVTISIADITSETSNTYTLSGGHTHTLTLSLSDIDTLKSSGSVVVESSTDSGHSHSVTVNCAG